MATEDMVLVTKGSGGEPQMSQLTLDGVQLKNGLEDLRAQIEVLREVNAHLNSEIENSTHRIEGLKGERDAWKKRAQQLCKRLNEVRKEATNESGDSHEVRVVPNLPSPEEVMERCRVICEIEREKDMALEGIDLHELVLKGRLGGWLVEPSELQLGNVIGEGAFGTTHRAIWRGAPVAVKCVTVQTKEDMISFLREAEALTGVRHPSILPFLGACIVAPTTFWLICEYMPGGTLAKCLYGDKGPKRSLLQRLQYALEIAQGMLALELCDPPILHRDLKPSNVFLDGSGHARVGDFGLARRLPVNNMSTLTSETGTYIYMSPEMVRHEIYDFRTDVWSWGVVLCELCTNVPPYQGNFWTPIQVAMAVADGKVKPTMPPDIHPGLSKLAELCFLQEPAQRPGFELIVAQLRAILDDLRAEANARQDSFLSRLLRRASFKERESEARDD